MTDQQLILEVYDADLSASCMEESCWTPSRDRLDAAIEEYQRRFRCKINPTRSGGWLMRQLRERVKTI